jgi:Tfp pilus assembly protein PilF
MAEARANDQVQYRVRLVSGRELGPLSLSRIQSLILKKHITGGEMVRILPAREWRPFVGVPELQALLSSPESARPPEAESPIELPGLEDPDEQTHIHEISLPSSTADEEGERTLVGAYGTDHGEPRGALPVVVDPQQPEGLSPLAPDGSRAWGPDVSNEKTQMLAADEIGKLPDPSVKKAGGSAVSRRIPPIWMTRLRWLVIVMGFVAVATELISPTPVEKPPFKLVLIDPKMPAVSEKQDPVRSDAEYKKGLPFYWQDTVEGYRKASKHFLKAAGHDKDNVRALAMLLSCYLNLVEVSKRDDDFSATVLGLQQRVKAYVTANQQQVIEAILSEVEYYVFTGKYDSAQHSIHEFSDALRAGGGQSGHVLLDYLGALVLEKKGSHQAAANLLGKYSDQEIPTPRIFHLRGQIAEAIAEVDYAVAEYRKAALLQPLHGRSQLRLAELLIRKGLYSDAGPVLKFLTGNPELLNPSEIARSWFLESRLNLSFERTKQAIHAIEKAIRNDPKNREYILESYRQKAKVKDPSPRMQREAKMYLAIIEAERALKDGSTEEAKARLLEAVTANPDSELPYLEMGDLFAAIGDFGQAKSNYRIAAFRKKNEIAIWSKYIGALIDSYEFDEANAAMERFRKMKVPQSAIDKAAGDLSAKQGDQVAAQAFFRSALSRQAVDPGVYIAFAKSLLETKSYQEASFYFSMALRLDPLSREALIGNAKAIAETEAPLGGIENAILYLEEQLGKGKGSGSEFLTAIAELEVRRGNIKVAKERLTSAFGADENYAAPWKVLGDIFYLEYRDTPLAKKRDKDDLKKRALDAYKSYSARSPSDAQGYYSRFKIFMEAREYFEARKELEEVNVFSPKHPRLHHYFGRVNMEQREYVQAVADFSTELKSFPGYLPSLIEKGKAFIALKQYDAAQKVLTEAMQRAPGAPDPKMLAGDVAMMEKRYAVALTLYKMAAALNPGSGEVHEKLAKTYRAMGDGANAEAEEREARAQRGQ